MYLYGIGEKIYRMDNDVGTLGVEFGVSQIHSLINIIVSFGIVVSLTYEYC
jgi:hypothetical protein